MLAPVRLNTVCFSLKDKNNLDEFLYRLNATGKVFLTATMYNGVKGIRAAFVNWRTSAADIQIATVEMNKILTEL